MGSLMGASFSRVFESMGVRLGWMTVYRDETSAQRRITPVASFALCGEVTVLTHAKRGMDRLEPR
ncbi:hypothetical protein EJ594_00830 [Pseudomonas aeruginosa]|nr:hypothetical protein IPC1191_32190 [Pseudomonas aeruginosa]RTB84776.1 hypothetical protein EJ594_00830 [Pseudomonas aeruginosa]